MSKNRNLADLLDSTGDVKSTNLDNVPTADVVNDTTPQLGGDLASNGNDVNFGDNDKAQFGESNDLQIYHDGSSSYIKDTGAGYLLIDGSNQIRLRTADGTENHVVCVTNGAVSLYHDNSKKFETTSTGVDITGTLTANGSAVGGQTKAWVVFNQSGHTIYDSYNVSSVAQKSETGRTQINFSTAFANTNYCMVSGAGESNGNDGYGMALKGVNTGNCDVRNQPDWNSSFGWTTRGNCAFMGDQ